MTEPSARILVVDDNRSNVELAVYILRAFGYETASVYDGAAALAALRDGKYDAVLVDLLMPGMDGYEFARRVRAEFAGEIPLVAVTALAMAGDRERILAAGFDGYIAKPIDPTTFAGEIASYLKRHPQRSTPLCHPERSVPLCHPERSVPLCHPERSVPLCHPERSEAQSKDEGRGNDPRR